MKLFLQRFLVIFIASFVTILVAYSCSAINRVSNYRMDLNDVINKQFENEKQTVVLIFQTDEQAYLATEKEITTYKVEAKDNLFYLTRENSEDKHILVPLSEYEILWQNKNIYLYDLEITYEGSNSSQKGSTD